MNKIRKAYEDIKASGPYTELYGTTHLIELNKRLAPHGYLIEKNRGYADGFVTGYFVSRFHGTLSNNPFVRAILGYRKDIFQTLDPQQLDKFLKENLPTRSGFKTKEKTLAEQLQRKTANDNTKTSTRSL